VNRRLQILGPAGALGSLALATLTLAALGGGWAPALDVLTHLEPLYLALGLGALLLGAVTPGPWRKVIVTAATVAVIASGLLVAPEVVSAATQPRSVVGPTASTFKIVQFNAWGGNRRAPAALAWLLAQNPDAIVMEEGGMLPYALVRRGYHLSCGNCYAAILTKATPVWANTPANWRIWPPDISIVKLPDPGGEITLLGVHRHWPNRAALYSAEMADLKAHADLYPKSREIVAGDFNSTPWSFARRHEDQTLGLVRRTRALFTWPAEQVSHNHLPALIPILPIDHVYAGLGWATVKVERGPRLGSDHYPVVVALAALQGSPKTQGDHR
jgi:endonuclease/exonuclease/phosphatase (EEP) superfamily protein YafD